MTDKTTHDDSGDSRRADDGRAIETDGGVASQAAQDHEQTDYLNAEVNLLNPSTPFMREHLKTVWTGFAIWAVIVFGPVTATRLAPGVMTTQMPVIGFPLHYFLIAFGGPTGALILSFWYARKRDALDEKYGIDPETVSTQTEGEAVAADGGVEE
jgi:putative solute:sodium symporter small subunit